MIFLMIIKFSFDPIWIELCDLWHIFYAENEKIRKTAILTGNENFDCDFSQDYPQMVF